jgi:hypothetical protein
VPEVKGLRLAVSHEYFVQGMQPGMEALVRAAIGTLEHMGAAVGEVSLLSTPYVLATYYIIVPAEASANLARFDGIKYGFSAPAPTLEEAYGRTRAEGFGPEVKRRIMIGTYALSATYHDDYCVKAQQARTLVKRDFDAVFATYDAVLAPTSPTTAFANGQNITDPVQMYLSDVCTYARCRSTSPASWASQCRVACSTACPSGYRSSRQPSMKSCSCVLPTPTSKARTMSDGGPFWVAMWIVDRDALPASQCGAACSMAGAPGVRLAVYHQC